VLSEPELPRGDCRDAYPKEKQIRIDGFGPGDDIRMGYPTADSAVRLRVHKVFLQSGSDSDIRVDASFLKTDGVTGSRWDVYMKGPGEFQFEKIQRREAPAR